MEPTFLTDPALREILDELIVREPIFHRPEFGTSRADFENMTAPDFWEIGASGQRYSRERVLDILDKRYAHPHHDQWETHPIFTAGNWVRTCSCSRTPWFRTTPARPDDRQSGNVQ